MLNTAPARHEKIDSIRALAIAAKLIAAHLVALVQLGGHRSRIMCQQVGLVLRVSLRELDGLIVNLGVNMLLILRLAPAHFEERLSGLLTELAEDLNDGALHAGEPNLLLRWS